MYTDIPFVFISMSTVLATWQTNSPSNHLAILPGYATGLATWSTNMTLDLLHATCHFTALYLNTKILPIQLLSNSYRIYLSILYFYATLLQSINIHSKECLIDKASALKTSSLKFLQPTYSLIEI